MYLLQRFFLVLFAGIGLLFAGWAGWKLVVEGGVSPSRYVIQHAGILVAGLVLMALCWRRSRTLNARNEALLERARQFRGDVLEATAHPLKVALGLLVLAGMASVSWLMYLGDGDWRLAVCAVVMGGFFVLLVPFAFAQHRPGKPTLRLDVRGLDHALYGQVPWEDVHGIYLAIQRIRHHEVKRLVLGVSNPLRYYARMPWIARLVTEQWRTPQGRYGTLVVGLQNLGVDPLLIVNAAEALRDRVSPPRLKYWSPSMDHGTITLSLEIERLQANAENLPPDEVMRRMEAVDPKIRALSHQLNGRG